MFLLLKLRVPEISLSKHNYLTIIKERDIREKKRPRRDDAVEEAE
jgi:hypothetical protein